MGNNKKTQKKLNNFIECNIDKEKKVKGSPKIDYDSLEIGQKAARVGLDSEKGIIKAVNTNQEFRELIRKCLMELQLPSDGNITCKDAEIGKKTDIIFLVENNQIGVSIKSRKTTSFHQTDRRRLEKWKNFLKMPDDVFNIIKQGILRISKNRNAKFILDGDRDRIMDFLSIYYNDIIKEIFTRKEDNLEVLLINDIKEEKIYLFKMKDAIDFLTKNIENNITFSEKGIIYFGNFLSIQRKGGNGKHVKIPKTDWEHPGNQLQFKFYPIQLVEHISKKKEIKFSAFDYRLKLVYNLND